MLRILKPAVLLVAAVLAAACSSNPSKSSDAIALEAGKKPALVTTQFRLPATVRIAGYQDGRRNSGSRKIGDIKSNVIGISGPDLMVEDDVANLVGNALKSRFEAAGYQVVDGNNAQFEVNGVVREFSLSILARDELAIVVETTLRDMQAGTVVWSGVVTEKTDRFAGVMGNSKKDIVKYLDGGLSTVAQKTADAITSSLKQVHPELFNPVVAGPVIPGVSVLAASAPQPSAVPAYVAPAAYAAPAQMVGSGYLSLTTTPARVKVYVDDVYFGLSPLKLELDAGIHVVKLKADGYKIASEKVSVRKGDTTELDMVMEK